MLVRRKTMERILTDRERAFAREREVWARERGDLLDRIMYLADRPWTPPPAEAGRTTSAPEVEWPSYPEQLTPDEMVNDGS